MIRIIFILSKPFSDPSCSVDEVVVILEETTLSSIAMFHHKIKVMICIDLQ